jgi:L-amino acid N-acyltransferase YncA
MKTADARPAGARSADHSSWVIRLATPADAAGVARVLNEVISEGRYSLLDTPFSDEEERAYIHDLAPRGFIHVAQLPAGEIAAVQTTEPYASFPTRAFEHVATMGTWVDEPHRRCGLGRRLCEASLAQARENGFTKILDDIRADNPESVAFHRAMGFSVVGTAKHLARLGGRYVDVVFVERDL